MIVNEIILWITENQELLVGIGLVSAAVFVASLVSLPWLVAMIPNDYFVPKKRQSPPWKNNFPAYLVIGFYRQKHHRFSAAARWYSYVIFTRPGPSHHGGRATDDGLSGQVCSRTKDCTNTLHTLQA